MDIFEHSRQAWDRESSEGGEWSTPVTVEQTKAAQSGEWEVRLTPLRPVPKMWFGNLRNVDLLCLASSGGQQAPILAASGANVTSFDFSESQLKKDRMVAERDSLSIQCIQGNMNDLSIFSDECFGIIFHAVSNVFVPDIEVIWRECYRVLRPRGRLLAGFMNPSFFLFDHDKSEKIGRIEVKYKLPYSEPGSLDKEGRLELEKSKRALEFSHSLETQIGGQLRAGFHIEDLYEDYWTDEIPLNKYSPSHIATKAIKP